MKYRELTACEAVLDFERRVWPGLFKGSRRPDNAPYKWAYTIIKDAKRGRVSDTRARALLEMYGGDVYRVTTSFEVADPEANGQRFGDRAAQFREKYPDAVAGWWE